MDRESKREMISTKLNKLLGTMNGTINVTECKAEIQTRKAQSVSVYDNRFQAQKEIIANQKATISEQKKFIEKLILKNTSLENELAFLKALVENLKQCSIRAEDTVSVNCEKSVTIPPKDSDILVRMKKREEERKKRWQNIKEQKANNERIRKVMLAEKDEDERLKLIEEKKKREQEDIDMKIAAEEELNRIREKKRVIVLKLKNWYWKHLVYAGFWQWTLYMKMIHAKREFISFKISKIVARKYIQLWFYNSYKIREKRMLIAKNNYLKTIQRKVINQWINFTSARKKIKIALKAVINKISVHKIIIQWKRKSNELGISREKKMIVLSECYFRELPNIIQEKREQEQRLRTWHSRVKEILPDFDAE